MLTIFGQPTRNGGFCDGTTRRDFLTVGGTILGGMLSLPRLLAAEARSGIKSHKAVINVFLPGGPPHLDMWDLKPDAPAEVRGEFRPIATAVPGLQICEHLPRLAGLARSYTLVRSVSHNNHNHTSMIFYTLTGRPAARAREDDD